MRPTFYVTLCVVQADPHRPKQLDRTPPDSRSKVKNLDPTRSNPNRPVDKPDP